MAVTLSWPCHKSQMMFTDFGALVLFEGNSVNYPHLTIFRKSAKPGKDWGGIFAIINSQQVGISIYMSLNTSFHSSPKLSKVITGGACMFVRIWGRQGKSRCLDY